MQSSGFSIFRLPLGMVAVMLINACTSSMVTIEPNDSVSFATVETSFPLSEKKNLRLKLRGSKTSGDFSQSVPSGKSIMIGNTLITGPTDVSGSTDLTYASVSIGVDNLRKEDKLRTFVYLGLNKTDIELTLLHGGNTSKIDDSTTELYTHLGLLLELRPSLYVGAAIAFSVGPDLSGISEFDLEVRYAIFRHLEVMGGYRKFTYSYDVEQEESNVNVEFSGPYLGINVPF